MYCRIELLGWVVVFMELGSIVVDGRGRWFSVFGVVFVGWMFF